MEITQYFSCINTKCELETIIDIEFNYSPKEKGGAYGSENLNPPCDASVEILSPETAKCECGTDILVDIDEDRLK